MIDFNFTKVDSPVFSYQNLIPCVTLNGSSQYLTVDITSTNYNLTGALTLGAWVKTNVFTTAQSIIGRWGDNPDWRSYLLSIVNDDTVSFDIVDSVGSLHSVTTTELMTIDVWTFVCGRFTPSTELSVWYNSTKYTNTTSIPATIFAGTAPFYIGNDALYNNYLNGALSLAFICGQALPDRMIELLYYQSKAMFYGISHNA